MPIAGTRTMEAFCVVTQCLPIGTNLRAWAAFWGGVWKLATLLQSWEAYVQEQGQWQPHQYR